MAENNNQILIGKQQANTVKENQNKDNELPKGGPAVIFGSKVEELKQKYLSKLPDLVLTKNDDTIQLPDVVFVNNDDKTQLPDVVFVNNDDKTQLPDVFFAKNDKELEKKKKEFLEDMKKEGLKENQLKKLAEIPVNEKSDYFFFVLVASTALGGPVGFALASLACEKLGIQPGGVIGDSRSFNPDTITTPIIKALNEIVLAVNQDYGYDKSLAPALISGFKSAVALVKEKFNPKKKVSPISAKCLGEANNSKHTTEVENQGQENTGQQGK